MSGLKLQTLPPLNCARTNLYAQMQYLIRATACSYESMLLHHTTKKRLYKWQSHCVWHAKTWLHLCHRSCALVYLCIITFVGLTFEGGDARPPKGLFQKGRQNHRDKAPVPGAICGEGGRAGVAHLKGKKRRVVPCRSSVRESKLRRTLMQHPRSCRTCMWGYLPPIKASWYLLAAAAI